MPVYWFHWDSENDAHIEEHGLTREEVEEVISEPEFTGVSRSSGRPIAEGYTSSGRYILCVYDVLQDGEIYPVTAFEID